MTDFDDEAHRMVLDAELSVAAHGVVDWLRRTQPGFIAITEWHAMQSAALERADQISRALEWLDHAPMFDDGILCAAPNGHPAGVPYPCRTLREHGERYPAWDDLIATYPADWDEDWWYLP